MNRFVWIFSLGLVGLLGSNCHPVNEFGSGGSATVQAVVNQSKPSAGGTPEVSMAAMVREVHLRADLVPRGSHGRKVVRPMKPRYITIHSTQNPTAGAAQHALALKRGTLRSGKRKGGNRIGYLIWHFTVDGCEAIQHLPITEQGEHADYGGPGNRLSIGIEMCEHRGNDLRATIERTAKLTAVLMVTKRIPLSNVVPHHHWPRWDKRPPHKNCPHFLLDNGRPGAKWRAFLNRVNYHYKRLTTTR
jgi:N-acetylmuramoyl-L-alanine amidase